MPATPIVNPVPGEDLLGMEPQLLQQVAPGWRHRLTLFTGRALSETALDGEQLYRAGLLATLGQAVSPGVVNGLVVSLDSSATTVVTVTAGYGISASGEDVYLLRDMKTTLSTIAVVDAVTGKAQQSFADYIKVPSNNSFAGMLLMQPVIVQATGATLDTGSSPLIVSGNLNASCDQDPDENAFADLQIVDAARLVFLPWPAVIPLPAQNPPETWRNRLAYAVFNAELMLAADDQLPWAMLGVPVALAGFDTSWKPLFVDCAAVVRAGGLPRRNYVLPVGADEAPSLVAPALLQARIAQFSEQLSQRLSAALALKNLSDAFVTAPPSGIVPAAALDFVAKKNLWFPPNWVLKAGPVHLEELETALLTGITASPIPVAAAAPADKTQLEPVEVLIPLPDELYDPNILVTETVSGDFQAEIDLATSARNLTLKKRKAMQMEANALITVLGPNVPAPNPNIIHLNADLSSDEIVGRDASLPYFPLSSSDPAKDETFGSFGPVTWQPFAAYIVGQFIIDPNRNIQAVQKNGSSGRTQPAWNSSFLGTTAEPVTATTTLTTPAVAAGSNILVPVASSNGFQIGQLLLIDTAANQEQFRIVDIPDATHLIADKLAKAHAAGVAVASLPPVTWVNNGPVTLGSVTWQRNSAYLAARHGEIIPGLFIVDSNGNIQTPQTPGMSGNSEPAAWGTKPGDVTSDGTLRWTCKGLGTWRPNTAYSMGQFIVDSKGNIQTVQTGGTSASTQPFWTLAKPTPDGGVTWSGNRSQTWQDTTHYLVGQWVLDNNGNIQIVAGEGTSAPTSPIWNAGFGQVTQDPAPTGIKWINGGPGLWQPNSAYVAGQFIFDRNGNLQTVQTAGTSGNAEPHWSTISGQTTADGKAIWVASAWGSVDLQKILTYPNAFPTGNQVPLFNSADQLDLANNGLQHFIADVNAKISRADDLINLAFLTVQTDIYRYRQDVLGTTDASRLATSPILANIATGDTAAVVAENLQTFFKTIPPPTGLSGGAASFSDTGGAAGFSDTAVTSKFTRGAAVTKSFVATAAAKSTSPLQPSTVFVKPTAGPVMRQIDGGVGVQRQVTATGPVMRRINGATTPPTVYKPVTRGTAGAAAAPSDVTQQQPLVGAELNVRTMTIAERLKQPPAQESYFYSISNRLAFMELLKDLEITIDDLPVIVDGPLPAAPAKPTDPIQPVPTEAHTFAEYKLNSNLLGRLGAPALAADSDEAAFFSVGIRVLEQHSQLLRALEGRVQQYRDFVSSCTAALNNVQANLQRAQTALKQLQNDLLQDRQDVAFTMQLLAEETLRVQAVNDRRTGILQTSVHVLAYARSRTVEATSDTPTRQLVPGDVTSPVPACLQQSIAIPPELREIVALLREAPVNWLPAVQALLTRLERPTLLYELAANTQARAVLQLQSPQRASFADGESGLYAPVISNLYYANQQVFHTYAVQRSSFQVAQVANHNWNSLVGAMQSVAAVGDMMSSAAVHAEVVNATSRLMTQISNVATCLYTRVSTTDPEYRLAWAEFLRGPGFSLQLRSLAILPNWTKQEYVSRDQMQLLVDWLFQQIDTSNSAAVAFMSDVVRVCILLASHAPVDEIITSALTVRTKPIVGGLLALNLPSERVASGMYVNLYSKGVLAAQAVVSDLDTRTVKATVTHVYQQNVFIETNDIAHFTAQTPNAVALRAFAK